MGVIVATPPLGPSDSDGGVRYSRLDNPLVAVGAQLHSVTIVTDPDAGTSVTEWPRVDSDKGAQACTNSFADYFISTSGGQSAAGTEGIASGPAAASVDDWLDAWPNRTDTWYSVDVVPWAAQGIRIGYSPLTVEVREVSPNLEISEPVETARVALDPSVELIPVEVVLMVHPGPPSVGPNTDAARQLDLWDQRQPLGHADVWTETWFGQVVNTHREFTTWHDIGALAGWDGSANAVYTSGTTFTPDSIFAQCGVQFRMANFFVLSTHDVDGVQVPIDLRNTYWQEAGISGNTDPTRYWDYYDFPETLYNTACGASSRLVQLDPRHIQGIPVVIWHRQTQMKYAYPRAVTYGSGADQAICVDPTTGIGLVLAHELAHAVAGLDDGACPGFMCSTEPQLPVQPFCADIYEGAHRWHDFFRAGQ